MRRIFIFSVICVLLLSVVGCSDSVDNTQSGAKHTDDTSASVDIDLTSLSSTMVYSEVYNIMSNPDEYIGKTIRMNGAFATDDNEIYYFCIIKDATACCQQGLEFILKGTQYPDGYPDIGADFTVQGTFERYMEGDQPYYHLIDAELC